jgi:23S rRNA (uracil1939-C5)-methyltransferase
MGRHKTRYRGPSLTADLGLAPGSRVSLTPGPLDEQGESVMLVNGAPVHVTGGIPGEQVELEVVRVFPERIAARVVEVLTPSPDRVVAPCPYYLECTGCQLQHMAYEKQLEFKRERVASELAKWPPLAGAMVMPTLPSPVTFGYRNHARFTVRKGDGGGSANGGTLGM